MHRSGLIVNLSQAQQHHPADALSAAELVQRNLGQWMDVHAFLVRNYYYYGVQISSIQPIADSIPSIVVPCRSMDLLICPCACPLVVDIVGYWLAIIKRVHLRRRRSR